MPVGVRKPFSVGVASLCALVGVLVFASAPALAAPEAPKIEAAGVSDVAATSATFSATLNPEGAETTYALEYAPAGGSFAPVPAGEGAGSVAEGTTGVALDLHVQRGLAAGTAYEFRLAARNSAGAVTGEPVPFTTQTAGGAFTLPDGRQYELVTPPQKQGALFEGITPPEAELGAFEANNVQNRIIQASAAGNAIVDLASQPTEAGPQGYSHPQVSVLSTRGASGWSSQVIAPPYAEGTVPVGGDEYMLFSQDLSRGVLQPYGNYDPLLSPEASESTAYARTDYLNGDVEAHCESSCFQPFVTAANTRPGVAFGEASAKGECAVGTGICGPSFFAATPDMSHIVLSSKAQLTSTPAPAGEEAQNIYEWSDGQLQLVSILPGNKDGTDGLWPAGNVPTLRGDKSARHEVSDDGGRIFLEELGGNVYMREVASRETVELDLAEPGCVSCGSGGGGHFMTASSDGSRVFFLDRSHLTAEASASGVDLYEYDLEAPAGHRLTDLTADPNAGEAADVQTVLGASEDGAYVYFVAGGRLAPGAVDDSGCEESAPEPCNLYVRHEGVTRFIAGLSGEDAGFWRVSGLRMEQHARVSPDGLWLAFMSDRGLTGYDTRDALSGRADEEVYLYDASANTLACASCDPTGARPVGFKASARERPIASFVPSWSQAVHRSPGEKGQGYQSRYLSDSGRLFFDSEDGLVPQDVNGAEDVYEYEPAGVPAGEHACAGAVGSGSVVFKPARGFEVEGVKGEEGAGCVGLISAGSSAEESTFLDASETGGDVFFLTTSRLVPQDVEGGFSVFDAHECTGESPCFPASAVAPPACETEAACRAAPVPQPAIYGAPASATLSASGNVVPSPPAPAVLKRAARSQKCPRGKREVRGKCRRKNGVRKGRKSKQADRKREGK